MAILWSTTERRHRCSSCDRPAGVFRSLIKTDHGWVCSREHCREGTMPIYVTCVLD